MKKRPGLGHLKKPKSNKLAENPWLKVLSTTTVILKSKFPVVLMVQIVRVLIAITSCCSYFYWFICILAWYTCPYKAPNRHTHTERGRNWAYIRVFIRPKDNNEKH